MKSSAIAIGLFLQAKLVASACDPSHDVQIGDESSRSGALYHMVTDKGAKYRGCKAVTKSGKTCQQWNSDSPHNSYWKNSGKVEANYCRNPDGEKAVWCYTTDPKVRFEECVLMENKAIQMMMKYGPQMRKAWKAMQYAKYAVGTAKRVNDATGVVDKGAETVVEIAKDFARCVKKLVMEDIYKETVFQNQQLAQVTGYLAFGAMASKLASFHPKTAKFAKAAQEVLPQTPGDWADLLGESFCQANLNGLRLGLRNNNLGWGCLVTKAVAYGVGTYMTKKDFVVKTCAKIKAKVTEIIKKKMKKAPTAAPTAAEPTPTVEPTQAPTAAPTQKAPRADSIIPTFLATGCTNSAPSEAQLGWWGRVSDAEAYEDMYKRCVATHTGTASEEAKKECGGPISACTKQSSLTQPCYQFTSSAECSAKLMCSWDNSAEKCSSNYATNESRMIIDAVAEVLDEKLAVDCDAEGCKHLCPAFKQALDSDWDISPCVWKDLVTCQTANYLPCAKFLTEDIKKAGIATFMSDCECGCCPVGETMVTLSQNLPMAEKVPFFDPQTERGDVNTKLLHSILWQEVNTKKWMDTGNNSHTLKSLICAAEEFTKCKSKLERKSESCPKCTGTQKTEDCCTCGYWFGNMTEQMLSQVGGVMSDFRLTKCSSFQDFPAWTPQCPTEWGKSPAPPPPPPPCTADGDADSAVRGALTGVVMLGLFRLLA